MSSTNLDNSSQGTILISSSGLLIFNPALLLISFLNSFPLSVIILENLSYLILGKFS